MNENAFAHGKLVSFLSAIVAIGMGVQQAIGSEHLARGISVWFVLIGIVMPFARLLDEKVGVVPLVLITIGQTGLLVVPLVVGQPMPSFLAALLAAFLVVVCTREERAVKRSAPTP